MKQFSVLERGSTLQMLSERTFDLLVVGGGINGAGIARDAAMRGMSVAVIEKSDFGSGTSSKSSKLVHGGVRYLEHYQFGLVHEASIERRVLLDIAPHLVKPLGFLMPVFRGGRHGPFFINLGLWLYDALAMFGNVRMHKSLGTADFARMAPGLRSSDLAGGALFYDAQTDDSRLTLETLRAAWHEGALALSHATVSGFLSNAGRVCGVEVEDRLGGGRLTVSGRVVVNATGPWSDDVRRRLAADSKDLLRLTKGVHIVLPPGVKDLEHAIVLISPIDGRVLFAIPWDGTLLVGTTDTDFDGEIDRPVATNDEVTYLLETLRSYFPDLTATSADVVGTFAGLRPLLAADGSSSASAVSREHKLVEESSGLLTLVGGKLTTYRKMAEEVVDRVAAKLRSEHGIQSRQSCRTARVPIRHFAAGGGRDALLRGASGVPPEAMQRFAARFPGEEDLLAALAREDRSLAVPLSPRSPYLAAEIVFACTHEMAATLPDLMIRRTRLFYREPDQGLSLAPRVADLAAAALGWSAAERSRQLELFTRAVAESRSFRA